MNKGNRKINKKKVILVVTIVIVFVMIGVFGRYIYNAQYDMYLTSKEFYFTSDFLDDNNSETINRRWNGKETFIYQFTLFSYKNEELRVDYDLNYEASCWTEDTDKIDCFIGDNDTKTTKGYIPYEAFNLEESNRKTINLYIKPVNGELEIGDKVTISVTATGTAGYKKTLKGRVTFIITEQEEFRYEIEDEPNSSFATLKLVNPKLSDLVTTLEFDPKEVRIDSNNKTYLQVAENNRETVVLDNGGEYVSKITFDLKQESSIIIKFYKTNKTKDYSHSSDDDTEGVIKISFKAENEQS